MKIKINGLLTLILVLLFILNTGVVFASTSDFNRGYEAGFSDGESNREKDISVSKAWSDHVVPDDIDSAVDYKEGYYDGYADGLKEPVKTDYVESLGKLMGSIYGARDFQNEDKSDWEDALPSDREIRNMFNLNMQDSDYEDLFIDGFTLAFKEAYIEAYEKAMFEPAKVTLDQGIKDGETLGGLLGATFGTKDFYENMDNDFTRNMPSNRVITSEYSLNEDSTKYKEGFLTGFIRAYEEEYNKAFREANINDTLRDEEDAFSNGKEIGIKCGEIQASQDYIGKLNNNWKRSLPSDSFIILEYGLRDQSENYREGFLSGFYDGYSEGYNNRYKEYSQVAGFSKSVSEIIPLAGGSLNTLDNAMNITIEPGTYYHPVNLTINTTYDASYSFGSGFIKSSDSYRVSILNSSNNFDDSKRIKIAFEYYGDRLKGGIYKYVNNNWAYIPSVVEDGMISAYIAPSSISAGGNTYSVFYDSSTMTFADARGHWAKDEINAYVRRGVIYGYSDMTFKPENNITRAEFLTLLSRVYNWNLSYYTGNTTIFKDYNLFGSRNNIISYALSSGYIRGYGDGTFKPNDPISYKEIQIIMGRVLNDSNFSWSKISTEMLYDRKVRSKGINDLNAKITRAEVVYMLYSITE